MEGEVMDEEVRRVAAALRSQGLSTLRAKRRLMRMFPSLESDQALAALEYVPESGLWSKANLNFGFGYKSPGREYDPVHLDEGTIFED